MNDTTQRDIGALQSDVRTIKEVQSEMQDDLREVRDFMRQAQGNWKMLVTLGSICAILGGLVAKALTYFTDTY